MRIAVIGSGGIGGLFATVFAEAGHDVTLCVRTPIEQLALDHDGRRHTPPLRISTRSEEHEPAELVVLATKAPDTDAAADWLRALVRPDTVVAVAQNGLGHQERVAPYVGVAPVLPTLVYSAVERVAPGQIVWHSGERVVIPDGPGADVFAAALAGTPLRLHPDPDFRTAVWRKMFSNVGGSSLTALTLRRMEVLAVPEISDLAVALLREAVLVAQADGATVDEQDVRDTVALWASFDPNGGSSMLYDRLSGRPMEYEYLTGAVVRYAHRYGVPAPLNEAMLALLRNLAPLPGLEPETGARKGGSAG